MNRRKIDVQAEWRKVKDMTAEQVQAAFLQAMEDADRALVRAAVAFRRIEELDLKAVVSEARKVFSARRLNQLRDIASGRTVPEVILRFEARTDLQDLIGRLPMDDQERLANGGTVKVPVIEGDRIVEKDKDPLELDRTMARRVFGGDKVATPAELRQHEERRLIEEATDAEMLGDVRLDATRGVAVFPGGREYTLTQLERVVSALRRGRRRSA